MQLFRRKKRKLPRTPEGVHTPSGDTRGAVESLAAELATETAVDLAVQELDDGRDNSPSVPPVSRRDADNPADSTDEPIRSISDDPPGAGRPSDGATPPHGRFKRLRAALRRTGSGLVGGISALFSSGQIVDANIIDELETLLLSADVGIEATDRILSDISARLKRRQLRDANAVIGALKESMVQILAPVEVPLEVPRGRDKPFVILMVGINGAGKTTTIGKLTQRFQDQGLSVLLAAGDTFRAAAVEQLQVWGERHGVTVVAQRAGADSASVAYDALESATARGLEMLIVDTAGRLHTQAGLMSELSKVHRVIGKRDQTAPHEVLLVLDAGTGQNALVQASQFKDAVHVSGIVLTKLDGTAKGGVIFSIAERLGVPIRFIGVGEAAQDLREFRAQEFVDALFATDTAGNEERGNC